MVDNVAITAGTGTTIAADDVGAGVLVQRVKTTWGPDGTANDTDVASGKPLPVQHRVSDGTAWTYGAGAVGSGSPRITLASDDPAVATLGATSGAKVITDANGTIQQYLRGLITQWISRTLTFASQGYTARVSVTRPSDTTTYAAGDVVGVTGGGTATITFANMGPAAGEILITSASFERDASAVISGETSYTLHLYNVTQPGAQIDNAVWDLASGDRTAYLGSIKLGTPVDLGSTLYCEVNGINKQVTLAGTSLYGVLVTDTGYQPASAAVHIVTLHAVAV